MLEFLIAGLAPTVLGMPPFSLDIMKDAGYSKQEMRLWILEVRCAELESRLEELEDAYSKSLDSGELRPGLLRESGGKPCGGACQLDPIIIQISPEGKPKLGKELFRSQPLNEAGEHAEPVDGTD